jgi:hypothetical protein
MKPISKEQVLGLSPNSIYLKNIKNLFINFLNYNGKFQLVYC